MQLTWAVDGKKKTGNPADYHQQDGETVAIYLLPKGADDAVPGPGLHVVRPDLRPEHRRGAEQGLAVPRRETTTTAPRDAHHPADVHAVTAASRANVVS